MHAGNVFHICLHLSYPHFMTFLPLSSRNTFPRELNTKTRKNNLETHVYPHSWLSNFVFLVPLPFIMIFIYIAPCVQKLDYP